MRSSVVLLINRRWKTICDKDIDKWKEVFVQNCCVGIRIDCSFHKNNWAKLVTGKGAPYHLRYATSFGFSSRVIFFVFVLMSKNTFNSTIAVSLYSTFIRPNHLPPLIDCQTSPLHSPLETCLCMRRSQ